MMAFEYWIGLVRVKIIFILDSMITLLLTTNHIKQGLKFK